MAKVSMQIDMVVKGSEGMKGVAGGLSQIAEAQRKLNLESQKTNSKIGITQDKLKEQEEIYASAQKAGSVALQNVNDAKQKLDLLEKSFYNGPDKTNVFTSDMNWSEWGIEKIKKYNDALGLTFNGKKIERVENLMAAVEKFDEKIDETYLKMERARKSETYEKYKKDLDELITKQNQYKMLLDIIKKDYLKANNAQITTKELKENEKIVAQKLREATTADRKRKALEEELDILRNQSKELDNQSHYQSKALGLYKSINSFMQNPIRFTKYFAGQGINSIFGGMSGKDIKNVAIDASIGLAVKAAKSLYQYMSKIYKKVLDVGKGIKTKIHKSLNSVLHVLKYMILRMSFRQLIKDFTEMFNLFTSFSKEFNTEFSKLYSTVKKINASFVTALAPAIQAMIPVLNSLANALANVLDKLAQLNSALFLSKTTYVSAKDYAIDYAEAHDKLSKSAGKSNKQLAAFDTINKLSDNSGSGADEINPEDRYGISNITEPILKLSERIKQMFSTGLGGYGLGEDIANWFDENVNYALNKISVKDLTIKSVNIGFSLADTLNGMIDNTNFTKLGILLGVHLQGMFTAAWAFLKTFNITGLGKQLGNMINNIMYSIDFNMLGQSIFNFLMLQFRLAFGLLETFDFGAAGMGLANILNGMLEAFNPVEIIEGINNAVMGIIKMIEHFVINFDWVTFGNKVADLFVSVLVDFDWIGGILKLLIVIGSVLEGLVMAIISFLSRLISDIFDRILGPAEETSQTWLGSVLSFMGGVIEGFLFLLTAPFETLVKLIKGILSGKTFGEIGTQIIEGLKNGIGNVWEKLKAPFENFFSGVKDFFGIHSPSRLFAEIGGFIMQGFNNGMNDEEADASPLTNMYDNIDGETTEVVSSLQNKWTSFGDNLKIIFDTIGEMMKSQFTTFVEMTNITMDCVEAGLNNMVSSLNSIIRDYNRAAAEVDGPTISYVSKVSLQDIPLPKLATGTVLPPNKPFAAIVGDQTHGTNVEAPLETIKQALSEVIGSNGMQRELVLEVEGREFGRAVIDFGNQEQRRIGTRFVVQ